MSEKENPSYYAIIPANVRYDENLKANEKLMYGEITVLSNKHGYCMAKNRYFADLYKVSIGTVSRWIKSLEDNGYISCVVIRDNNSMEVIERRVYLKTNIPSIEKDQEGYIEKDQDPIVEKRKDNNTSFNITRSNNTRGNKEASSDAMHDHVMGLVEAWNQIQGYNGIEMTKVQSISKTSARYRATVSRIKEHDFDTVYDVLRKVSKSDFLRGDSRTRWTADFGWVMRPTNFEKILEDTYINKGNGNAECNSNNQQNRKLSGFQEFATELSDRVDKNRHLLDELPDDYIF